MESFTFDGTELSQKSSDTLSRVDDVFFVFDFANDVAESFLSVCDWDLPSDIDSGRPPSELPLRLSLNTLRRW